MFHPLRPSATSVSPRHLPCALTPHGSLPPPALLFTGTASPHPKSLRGLSSHAPLGPSPYPRPVPRPPSRAHPRPQAGPTPPVPPPGPGAPPAPPAPPPPFPPAQRESRGTAAAGSRGVLPQWRRATPRRRPLAAGRTGAAGGPRPQRRRGRGQSGLSPSRRSAPPSTTEMMGRRCRTAPGEPRDVTAGGPTHPPQTRGAPKWGDRTPRAGHPRNPRAAHTGHPSCAPPAGVCRFPPPKPGTPRVGRPPRPPCTPTRVGVPGVRRGNPKRGIPPQGPPGRTLPAPLLHLPTKGGATPPAPPGCAPAPGPRPAPASARPPAPPRLPAPLRAAAHTLPVPASCWYPCPHPCPHPCPYACLHACLHPRPHPHPHPHPALPASLLTARTATLPCPSRITLRSCLALPASPPPAAPLPPRAAHVPPGPPHPLGERLLLVRDHQVGGGEELGGGRRQPRRPAPHPRLLRRVSPPRHFRDIPPGHPPGPLFPRFPPPGPPSRLRGV
ncbi:P2X purinoceptor 3 isoform X1 [Pseudopipra pipra]|uniref:P2X purinoceptor 3 isoform X1 n=1 Tax=Pseudopipra pipra TaxID=415032 RepID=UPI00313A078C